MEAFLIGLMAALFGAVFVFAGYQFMRVLLPLVGFVAGFAWGAQAVTLAFGSGFLSTGTGWLVGIIVGALLAAAAYLVYELGVGILAAFVGYLAVYSFAWQLGLHGGITATLLSLAAGVTLAIATVYYKAPKAILVLLTSLGGSTAMVGGLLVLLGLLPVASLGTSVVAEVISHSAWWTISWLALVVIGIGAQYRLSQTLSEDTSYLYADDPMVLAGAKGGEVTGPPLETADTVDQAQVDSTPDTDEHQDPPPSYT